MFHICFCANEPYAKYTATLITSIIHSTDISKRFGDFFANANSMGGGNWDLSDSRDLDSRDSCHKCADLDSRDSPDLHDSHDSRQHSHLHSYPKRNYDLLSDDEKSEGYIFHIFSDFLSDDSRTRFSKLSKD